MSEHSTDAGVVPEPSSVTYVDYENPFALVQDASGAPHVAQISRHAWVGCGGGIYVLECMGKGYIRVETDTDENGTRFSGTIRVSGTYTHMHS
jgi:ATP-dependent helicase IRC3